MQVIGAFDIETTQPYKNKKGQEVVKCFLACVYYHKITKIKGYKRVAEKPSQEVFTSIGQFVNWCKDVTGVLYVHNLKFEWSYLIPFLLVTNTPYEILESTMSIYSVRIGGIKLQDTGNYFVGESLDDIGLRLLGYGKIEHSVIFEQDHIATDKDIEYCLRDCEITYKIAMCHITSMQEIAQQITDDTKLISGLAKKLTNSGMAFSVFMATQDKDTYNSLFPLIPREVQEYMRKAYFGGLVGVKVGEHHNVHSYDIVNCYPSCMVNNNFPCGMPQHTEEWEELSKYDYWVSTFELFNVKKKPDTMTTLLKKGGLGLNIGIEKEEHIIVRLCSQDYKLLLDNYDCDINFIDGYYFTDSVKGIDVFGTYILTFAKLSRELKQQAEEAKANGNKELAEQLKAQRNIVKVFLNGLYGKFSTRTDTDDYAHIMGEESIVQRKTLGRTYKEDLDIYYLPTAIYITAYARTIMSNAVKAVDFRNVVNWDTDSIKTTKPLPDSFIEDSLGKWGYEFTALTMKCVAPKCYSWTYIDKDGKLDFAIKAKGISKKAIKKKLKELEEAGRKFELFDNFNSDLEFDVLQSRRVIGGTALTMTKKKIKRGK